MPFSARVNRRLTFSNAVSSDVGPLKNALPTGETIGKLYPDLSSSLVLRNLEEPGSILHSQNILHEARLKKVLLYYVFVHGKQLDVVIVGDQFSMTQNSLNNSCLQKIT